MEGALHVDLAPLFYVFSLQLYLVVLLVLTCVLFLVMGFICLVDETIVYTKVSYYMHINIYIYWLEDMKSLSVKNYISIDSFSHE